MATPSSVGSLSSINCNENSKFLHNQFESISKKNKNNHIKCKSCGKEGWNYSSFGIKHAQEHVKEDGDNDIEI